jgi:tripartite-type tricarboxylate transporter receptor subunit TctC
VTCSGGSIGMLGSHIKPGGGGRPLVLFDAKRSPDLPDVPTSREKGYDITSYHYVVLISKKGAPQPVLDTLLKIFKQAADDPIMQSALSRAAMIPLYLDPKETLKLVRQDFDRSREVFGKK